MLLLFVSFFWSMFIKEAFVIMYYAFGRNGERDRSVTCLRMSELNNYANIVSMTLSLGSSYPLCLCCDSPAHQWETFKDIISSRDFFFLTIKVQQVNPS